MQDKGIALATARAGNVIGGGDWAVDRIVPDAMRAFIANKPLVVRNPMAIRPWQHVLEPLSGYLMLCQQLINQPDDYAREWNFGPNSDDAKPVSYLADGMVQFWGDSASWQLDENDHPHEANHLKLDCSRANTVLKWKPIWDINQALSQTVSWYRRWNEEKDMYNFTIQQIEEYQQA
jgi:CDP-glucose 4,6-dehydratase